MEGDLNGQDSLCKGGHDLNRLRGSRKLRYGTCECLCNYFHCQREEKKFCTAGLKDNSAILKPMFTCFGV